MKHKHCFALAAAVLFSACSGGGAPTVPNTPVAPGPSNGGHKYNVGPYVAQFTEYPLPAGQSDAADITVGPDGAVWFKVLNGVDQVVLSGKITEFPAPPQFAPTGGPAIASFNGALWYAAASFTQPEQFLVRQGTSGAATMKGSAVFETIISHLTVGPDGRLWATILFDPVEVDAFDKNGFLALRVTSFPVSPGIDVLEGIAPGPDGNLYVTASTGVGPNGTAEGKVVQLSTSGTILNTFLLPSLSDPRGIVTGPDGALWIADPGTNTIMRMTTAGSVMTFPLPTANAQPFEITKGTDGALWFTEQNANAIGRITTSGSITEYPVPTANAGVFGITTCPQQCENAHGRLWFTEQKSGKVAKFEF